MRNDSQKSGDGGVNFPRQGRVNNGIIPNSFRAVSRIVSSGASTVASTVRSTASAASAIVEREGETNHDEVSWAGFDKLELERGITRQILLLGFSYGFQVWDVEVADNVHNLVSRHDGPVSFMQMLPKPLLSNQSGDKFADSRPLIAICADGSFSGSADGSFSGSTDAQEASNIPCNGSIRQGHGTVNNSYVPTLVWFYSLRSQSYVHLLRFRSTVHLVRSSAQVVAVLQSAQIHCLNAATLEREHTILTNPVPTGTYGYGNLGVGPLAVGPRWMAYSGSQVANSNSGYVNPQHLTPSSNFPCPASNGSLVAHYAKESSKQLAAGIVTLGDMGYKKLSRYYSELLPEGNNVHSRTARGKVHGSSNGDFPDADNVGMVIVRDIASKNVIAQFRAHKSPILSLCFDPSGTLLVTASVQGRNINVFRIMPGLSGGSSGDSSGPSYVHLYRLQRGFTNAVIQDISFSSDSQWIMISSSRGTSHLFAISPSGGSVSFQSRDSGSSLKKKPVYGSSNSGLQVLTQHSVCASGPPLVLFAVSRIRNGSSNSWRYTVSGAAAAAVGQMSSLSGAIASAFHDCKGNDMLSGISSQKKNHNLLVFSPSGCVIQYELHFSPLSNGMTALPRASESSLDYDVKLMVEAIQKWKICQKQSSRGLGDNIDMSGENGNPDNSKVDPERMTYENNVASDVFHVTTKGKIMTEEKHHMHISEAELHMHHNQNPLWARPEIYFQPMQKEGFNVNQEDAYGGEIEIERVPIRMPETRSKNLVPVFDYPYANGGIAENETDNGLHKRGQNRTQLSTENSRGSVNTNDAPRVNARLGTVNTRDDSVRESQHRTVHN